MEGYVPHETFEDFTVEEQPGLKVRLRLAPIDFMEWLALMRSMESKEGAFEERLRDRYGRFIALAKPSWNLDAPVTVEGCLHQDINLMTGLIGGWNKAVAEVPVPLVQRSNGIATSVAKPRSSGRKRNS